MKPAFPMPLAAALGASLLAACTVGPDYQRADAPVPAAYKEQPPEGWKTSKPQEAGGGAWWAIYGDPVLDGLERQVEVSNQTLKASEAAFRQAEAVLREARASFFPTLGVNAGASRARSSTSRLTQNQFSLAADAGWAPDVWGRVRRLVESDSASAQASSGDLASARLSAQALLAQDYFELRIADELQRLLDETVAAYTKSLQITRNRYTVGVAAKSDVVTAETLLQNTMAQAVNVGVQRAQLEHAIAVLTGHAPADFTLAAAGPGSDVPEVPGGLPSSLLERRPDIAAAERRMAASNAQIGVAIAAYFPSFTLSGSGGYDNSSISKLFNTPSLVWSLGGQVAETVFDAGLRSAQVDQARAAYEQSVAEYRQTVLSGLQQVEDQLSAQRILKQQADVQQQAVTLAKQAEQLTLNEYKAGIVDYTSVVTAQTTALSTEQNALTIRQSRLVASVTLIEALGGGWDTAQLPGKNQLN
ncbi:MAG: efflux transporter outer membrane subunit [Nevskia sp.]|nr:efflux transporter outer membrane subunit [Nevskia sp.]